MKKTIISIDHLSCVLGGKEIIRDISLAVTEGEYVSIVGPNGSGKTTLLKSLVRIVRAKQGAITIAGKPLEKYSQRELARLVAYVPQADGLPSPFSVEEFVTMARYPYLSSFSGARKKNEEAVAFALETTETCHLADRLLSGLSGGERQRVFIAAALAQEAPVMLLDEPTTFLDPKHVADILVLLERINKEHGVTTVSVTHDINGAALSGGRVVALKNGTVVFCGEPGEFMDKKILNEIYGMRFHFIEHPETGKRYAIPVVDR